MKEFFKFHGFVKYSNNEYVIFKNNDYLFFSLDNKFNIKSIKHKNISFFGKKLF